MNRSLTNNELIRISGGAVKFGVIAAIVGTISFLIGVVDGFIRPFKCR